LFSSCELDLQESPNNLSPEDANPDFLLNNVQLSFRNTYNGFHGIGANLSRMEDLFGSNYQNAYQATSFDGIWENAYAGLLVDADVLTEIGVERELFHHAGIAQILSAYTLVMLVDNFGDVPYSQILDGANLNPERDNAADVYAAAMQLLDDGVANLDRTPLTSPAVDLYFDGNIESWKALANSLKLKMYVQQRLTGDFASNINTIAGAELIDAANEAFVFQYSTNGQNPDARHPDFASNYQTDATEYMQNYYMAQLYTDKNVVDPRMRYYFYRQTTTIPNNVQVIPCINRDAPSHWPNNTPFCTVGDGYWGRDHLDDDGIPPDNLLRTTFGVYPAGGRFDQDQGQGVSPDFGLQGAGILPIYMHFYTDFLLAEAALTIPGVNGDPAALLESGIRKSIDYVIDFGSPAVSDASFVPSSDDIDDYVDEVIARYTAANSAGKLDVIIKEFYISAWGNGYEAYNMYRRTGSPSDIQPTLQPNPGDYYRSFIYPASHVQRNNNASQKPDGQATPVFWDPGTINLQ